MSSSVHKGNLLPEKFHVSDHEYDQLRQQHGGLEASHGGGSASHYYHDDERRGVGYDSERNFGYGGSSSYENTTARFTTTKQADPPNMNPGASGPPLWGNPFLPSSFSPEAIQDPSLMRTSEPFSPSTFLFHQGNGAFGNEDGKTSASVKENDPTISWETEERSHGEEDYMPSSLESLEDLDNLLYKDKRAGYKL